MKKLYAWLISHQLINLGEQVSLHFADTKILLHTEGTSVFKVLSPLDLVLMYDAKSSYHTLKTSFISTPSC